jgi:hypothetical protein
MTADTRIEHSYPAALSFLQEHGPDAVAVLHDLLVHAELQGGNLVAKASVRQIAGRLRFLSKDSVNRRLHELIRAGVLHRSSAEAGTTFEAPSYVIHLNDSGITLVTSAARPARPA